MAKVVRFFTSTVGMFLLLLLCSHGIASAAAAGTDHNGVTAKVICNVVLFVQKLGLPIMTGVILGSSVMAIFGRLAWPSIAMLIVFTAIFFGSSKIIGKFAQGVGEWEAEKFDCKDIKAG
ncbi:type IV secretion system protein VirB2-7 [Anaplasma phagocytophilum]|uniref:Type IV secretion system protein n=4 Tax=Anaplasma phagocytophilum TaxID=948 RepID=K9P1J8_ANAPH|nr:type IV secretion system protein VirB2-7 [Anaplasma phagocytophilum]ABD43968.1 Type IV secretion protein VirB2 homolog VirB2-7 [Anaplasma phagocytophilum str. HZ]AFY26751.1 type IV secretion system protein [Anaplasma phagocytophilum]AGR79039.1 type VI secretion protein [Anaplasma phagocytophilum str. HZ2]AGR81540.1 type VI secretion protein [Anaplasma phagocytophilum str. Dog2]EOA61357.1 VirB2 [Anaplasma phagocytophilum str. HGE1]